MAPAALAGLCSFIVAAETSPAAVAGLCSAATAGFYPLPTASVIVPFWAEHPSGVREKGQ